MQTHRLGCSLSILPPKDLEFRQKASIYSVKLTSLVLGILAAVTAAYLLISSNPIDLTGLGTTSLEQIGFAQIPVGIGAILTALFLNYKKVEDNKPASPHTPEQNLEFNKNLKRLQTLSKARGGDRKHYYKTQKIKQRKKLQSIAMNANTASRRKILLNQIPQEESSPASSKKGLQKAFERAPLKLNEPQLLDVEDLELPLPIQKGLSRSLPRINSDITLNEEKEGEEE